MAAENTTNRLLEGHSLPLLCDVTSLDQRTYDAHRLSFHVFGSEVIKLFNLPGLISVFLVKHPPPCKRQSEISLLLGTNCAAIPALLALQCFNLWERGTYTSQPGPYLKTCTRDAQKVAPREGKEEAEIEKGLT